MTRTKTVANAAHKVVKADIETTHEVARHRDTPPVRALAFLAEAADQPPLTILALGTVVFGIATKRRDIARGGVRMLLAHGVATAAKTVIKRSVDRARPERAIEQGDERFEAGHTREHSLNSFPSGHTASAVAVARAIGRDVPAAAAPAAFAATAAGLAQPPTGHHYMTDVVAGAAIGWAAEAAASMVFDRLEPRATAAMVQGAALIGKTTA